MGGGGFLGKVVNTVLDIAPKIITGGDKGVELLTGGLVKSNTAASTAKMAEVVQAQKAQEVVKQKAEVVKEVDDRKKRVLKAAQGRRGLLWQGTGELGVQGNQTTSKLGG